MKRQIILFAALALAAALTIGCVSQPQEAQGEFPQPDLVIDLWPDGAPTDNGLTGDEIDYGNHVSNVTRPTLALFFPEKPGGLALLVCPGGGYVDVWDKTEGYAN